MFHRSLAIVLVGLAAMFANASHARAFEMSAVPVPMMKPPFMVADTLVDQDLAQAEAFLAMGAFGDTYYYATATMEKNGATADLHAVAAKAALSEVKSVSLLRKKRWAKRGRDNFIAALSLDESHEDALFGLATFALRAPSGLGGGDEALQAYRKRLSAVSQQKSAWLDARVHAEQQQHALALKAFGDALAMGSDDQLVAEIAQFAIDTRTAAQAYETLTSVGVGQASCLAYHRSVLAQAAELSTEAQYEPLRLFVEGEERYCGRQFVSLLALERAQVLAQELGLQDAARQFLARAVALAKERAPTSTTLKPTS